MPALNFRPHFAPLVKNGRKCCTIRAPRKRSIRPGDTLLLYTGMRTRACRRLRTAVCRSVEDIYIEATRSSPRVRVRLAGRILSSVALRRLAREDGYASPAEFAAFFPRVHGLPFSGHLIRW
jgi:hypothetical protein